MGDIIEEHRGRVVDSLTAKNIPTPVFTGRRLNPQPIAIAAYSTARYEEETIAKAY